MGYATLGEEKKLWRKGYRGVACLDEVGRGCLGGAVFAAAVALLGNSKLRIPISRQITKLKDSKKLTEKQRERFYEILTAHPSIRWGIGKAYQQTIDRINIFEATKLAMKRALHRLEKKLEGSVSPVSHGRRKQGMIDFLILDGKMALDVPLPQKSIVKADEKVFSCALASIIAKVKRDRSMKRYHKKYPQYGFDRHKGYGTPAHRKALLAHGPCPIHRKTFHPVIFNTGY